MNPNAFQPASNAYSYPLLIKSILKQTLKYNPGNEIVYKDVSRYNYFDLNKRVARLSNLLTELGLGYGDTVGWMDYDSHRYLESFYAVPSIGAVLHTINYRYSAQNIVYTINHAEDKVLFVHADFIDLILQNRAQFTHVEKIILLLDGNTLNGYEDLDEYENLMALQKGFFEYPEFSEDFPALTFYTSGTTGKPKGVYFSHRQIVTHAMASMINFGCYEGACRLRSNDVYMPLSPMFHVHSGGFPYVASMLNVKQVYPGRINPALLLKLIREEGITFTHTVPTLFNMIIQHEDVKRTDLSKLKVVIVASATTNTLLESGHKLGIDMISSYGMSESCPIITFSFLNPCDLELDAKSQYPLRMNVGKPVPFMDVKIIDERGHDVSSPNQIGEIVLRSPWLTKGYNKEDAMSEELWQGGWLHTSDIGYMDQTSRITLVDRKRDMIKSGGEWVAPSEIENLLGMHPNIKAVAVFGIADEKWEERPVAAVILKEPTSTIPELLNFLGEFVASGKLNKISMVEKIKLFEEFPTTGTGKVDKKHLKELWLKA